MLTKIFHRPAAVAPTTVETLRLGYMPGLDGLRALAVLAVLLYHADVLWLPGGFLGVEIFFVVSGYLITSLLLAEYRARNSVSLKNFWQRRARRLLPALFALIGATLLYSVLFLPDEVASLKGDVVAAFTYVTNWYLIFSQQSYFEQMGRPSLLRHLWSLAVEEQFYLLFPLLFVFLLARVRSRVAMLILMLGATASALWMGLLFVPDADPSRIYYGTDTRAAGLLIGAALAFAWKPQAGDTLKRGRRWLLDAVGILALGGLVAAVLALGEFDPFLYQGGMLLVAGATALVIAAVVHPQSPILGPLLGFGVLRWIGLRSYSLYLWHWPVFMVTRPELDTTLTGAPLLLLRFGLAFALAELSYRVVETPIRRGALGKAWHGLEQAHGLRRVGLATASAGALVALGVGIFMLGSAVWNAKPQAQPDYVLMTPEEEAVSGAQDAALLDGSQEQEAEPVGSSDMLPVSFVLSDVTPEETDSYENAQPVVDGWLFNLANQPKMSLFNAPHPVPLANEPLSAARKKASNCDEACQTRRELLALTRAGEPNANRGATNPTSDLASRDEALPPRLGPAQIFAIGDSVMLGASNYLRQSIDVDVDAKLGRQVSSALEILKARKDANQLTPVVVVHLGNNGTFSAKQLDEMMALLSDVEKVIFLTDRVPRKWQVPNNTALEQGVARYPNAVLIDWNAYSADHPEWFWKDGIHLRPEGAKEYTDLIANTIAQVRQKN